MEFYDIYFIDPRNLMFPNITTPGGWPSHGVILESSLLYMESSPCPNMYKKRRQKDSLPTDDYSLFKL